MRRRRDVVEDTEHIDLGVDEEAAADAFARESLLPRIRLEPFLEAGDFGRSAVIAFAREAGVAPGIVVGRLQHDGLIRQGQLNDLKRSVELAS